MRYELKFRFNEHDQENFLRGLIYKNLKKFMRKGR